MSLFSQLFNIFRHTDVLERYEGKSKGKMYEEVRSMLNEEADDFDEDMDDYDDFEDEYFID